ncbi:porin [Psychrobacter sp. NG25]|uniref:porin n=1 Tax=Psychrobacter sp. NG25 TaxID=2782005 RepID=UPI0018835FDA|nr:porin [Psychrobacter sp. NG25]MBF0659242.1 porin [Psychrobacter sp. NG25]
MKKLLLATAVAALSVSAANAAPTVYGKAFVGMDYVDIDDEWSNKNEDSVQINSYSSRLGFKGSEAITANTDVIYQYEVGINIDGNEGDDNNIAFKSRDTFLGFKNDSYGELRFGRNTSVVDYVNNVVTSGSGFWDNLGSNQLDENENGYNMTDSGRRDNSVIWMAPKYNNLPLDVALMYKANESLDDSTVDADAGFAASAMYDAGTGITFGAAYDNDVNLDGDLLRATAAVDLSKYMAAPVTVGAMYQVADFDASQKMGTRGSEKEKGLVVSAKMGLNNFAKPAAVYIQYNNTDNLLGFSDADSDQIVVGGEYNYKPNMIAHVWAGQNSADLGGSDYDLLAIGGGLEYKF